MLARAVLMVEVDDDADPDVRRRLAAFAGELAAGLLVGAREPSRLGRRPAVRLDVAAADPGGAAVRTGTSCSARAASRRTARSTG